MRPTARLRGHRLLDRIADQTGCRLLRLLRHIRYRQDIRITAADADLIKGHAALAGRNGEPIERQPGAKARIEQPITGARGFGQISRSRIGQIIKRHQRLVAARRIEFGHHQIRRIRLPKTRRRQRIRSRQIYRSRFHTAVVVDLEWHPAIISAVAQLEAKGVRAIGAGQKADIVRPRLQTQGVAL